MLLEAVLTDLRVQARAQPGMMTNGETRAPQALGDAGSSGMGNRSQDDPILHLLPQAHRPAAQG